MFGVVDLVNDSPVAELLAISVYLMSLYDLNERCRVWSGEQQSDQQSSKHQL